MRCFPAPPRPSPDATAPFADCEARLPICRTAGLRRALPAAHPSHRAQLSAKGKNNSPTAEPGDVGSPWAIGAKEGGHTAIHPRSWARLRTFAASSMRAAKTRASRSRWTSPSSVRPTIPGSASIRSGSSKRPDGTIQYAENPPKKYQDIYPLDFREHATGAASGTDCCAMSSSSGSTQGVRIFRVDNPHTKAFPFWEWVIAGDQARISRRDLPGRGLHAARASCSAWRSSASRSPTPTSPGATRSRSSRSTSTS